MNVSPDLGVVPHSAIKGTRRPVVLHVSSRQLLAPCLDCPFDIVGAVAYSMRF